MPPSKQTPNVRSIQGPCALSAEQITNLSVAIAVTAALADAAIQMSAEAAGLPTAFRGRMMVGSLMMKTC